MDSVSLEEYSKRIREGKVRKLNMCYQKKTCFSVATAKKICMFFVSNLMDVNVI